MLRLIIIIIIITITKNSSRKSDLIIIKINDPYLGKYFDLCTI
jgi:hypothetical protein